MKYLDSIVVTTDKYANHGIKKGTKGAIVMPEIRYNSFDLLPYIIYRRFGTLNSTWL